MKDAALVEGTDTAIHAVYTSPHEKHFLSWGVLWGGYVLASVACSIPVFCRANSVSDIEEAGERETGSGDSTRNQVRSIEQSHRLVACGMRDIRGMQNRVAVLSALSAFPECTSTNWKSRQ